MENGYIESLHGKFAEDCLNKHWFLGLDDMREKRSRAGGSIITKCANNSASGYLTLEEFIIAVYS